MKKAFIIIMICGLLCLGACTNSSGKFMVKSCVSNQNSTSFSMRYSSCKGEKTYTIKTEADAVMHVEFETKSGELDCTVRKKGGDVIYEKTNVQSEKFTIELKDGGKYEIILKARDHSGSFSFDWKK